MKLKHIIMYRKCSDLFENTFGHIISVNQAVDEKLDFFQRHGTFTALGDAKPVS